MSDNINKDDGEDNNLRQKKGDEYTMKDVIESNSYARRIDRQNKKKERPIEIINKVDCLVLKAEATTKPVKRGKHTPKISSTMKKCYDDDTKKIEVNIVPTKMKEKLAQPTTKHDVDTDKNEVLDSDEDEDDLNNITEEEWLKLQNIEESF